MKKVIAMNGRGDPIMKSNPKDEKCKQCYANSKKKRGALLYCEATGVCKYIKVRGDQS